DPLGPVGKLATVWFEELVLQVPTPDAVSGVLSGEVANRHQIRPAVADDLLSRIDQEADPGVGRAASRVACEEMDRQYSPHEESYAFARDLSANVVSL